MQCIVSGCRHDTSTSYVLGITFYMVPTEPTLRKKWFQALGADGYNAPEVSMVCSDHFLAKDLYITKGGQRRLRADAMPVVQYLPKCAYSTCDVKVCRICLATDCKLYSMANHINLHDAYASLAGLMTDSEDGLPPYICTMCAHRLMKCARFKSRSVRAHLLLLDLVNKHRRITLEIIKAANKNQRFNSSLSITHKVNHYDLDIVYVKKETEDAHENNNAAERSEARNNIVFEIVRDGGSTSKRSNTYPPDLHEEADLEVKIENDSEFSDDVDVTGDDEKDDESGETAEDTSKPVIVYIKSEKPVTDDSESADTSDEDVSLAKLRKANVYSETNETIKTLKDRTKERDRDVGQSSRKTSPRTTLRTTKLKQQYLRMNEKNNCHLVPLNKNTHSRHYSCNVCKKRFRSIHYLQKHLQIHFNGRTFTCQICKKSFDLESKFKRHLKIHERKKFVCDLCEKSFKSESNLEIHLRIHNGEKPYICDCCNSAFKDKSDLRKHLKNHYNLKPFSCDLCSKSFSIKSKLKRHVFTHFYKKHTCYICHKTFRGENTLALHLQVHSGLKPFVCDICKSSFKDKRDLRKHLIIHTGLKPFKCDLCEKSFSMKSKLSRHLITHTGTKPFSCKICSKAFGEKGNLQKHSRIHTNRKPYSCGICKKSFTDNSVLKRHMKIHFRDFD